MKNEELVIVILTVIFWVGVFTGSLSHVTYTNSNMDTFIHGFLFTWGTGLSIRIVRGWYKNRATSAAVTRESV